MYTWMITRYNIKSDHVKNIVTIEMERLLWLIKISNGASWKDDAWAPSSEILIKYIWDVAVE